MRVRVLIFCALPSAAAENRETCTICILDESSHTPTYGALYRNSLLGALQEAAQASIKPALGRHESERSKLQRISSGGVCPGTGGQRGIQAHVSVPTLTNVRCVRPEGVLGRIVSF